MKLIKFGFIALLTVYITGCATGAKMENMVYNGEGRSYPEALKENVEVAGVLGGEKTNPAWTSKISDIAFEGALKESLKAQGLLSDNGKYQLAVNMVKVAQPLVGLNMKVTTHIKYTLTDKATNAVVFDEVIEAPHVTKVGEALVATKRLRLANEGSGMKNIEAFLAKLSDLKLDGAQITMAK